MRKKTIILLVVLFFSFLQGSTQSFMQSIGANLSILKAKINTPYERYTFVMSVNHFSYFPRVNLSESENSSFSVGLPVGAGIGILTENGGNATGIAWGFDLPIVADYNFGCKSTPDNPNRSGGYVGAGFGYMYTAWNAGDGTENANSYGPIGRCGLRFGSANGNWNMTLGIYIKFGLEATKYKTFGFNVLADL